MRPCLAQVRHLQERLRSREEEISSVHGKLSDHAQSTEGTVASLTRKIESLDEE